MKLKDVLLIILCTIIFTSLIFFIRSQFFGTREDLEIRMIEEKYIEPVSIIPQTFLSFEEEEKKASFEEQLTLNSASPKITFTYIPKSF
jgi:hypothetical protein